MIATSPSTKYYQRTINWLAMEMWNLTEVVMII